MRPLWRRADGVTVVGANTLAALLLVVGWWGASRALTVDRQTPWANLSVAALVVAGIGNGLWLMAGRVAVARRARSLRTGGAVHRASCLAESRVTAQLVALPSLSLYHREDCRMVNGRATVSAAARDHAAAGRRPCGMCRP